MRNTSCDRRVQIADHARVTALDQSDGHGRASAQWIAIPDAKDFATLAESFTGLLNPIVGSPRTRRGRAAD
jgi:hypothetical protein